MNRYKKADDDFLVTESAIKPGAQTEMMRRLKDSIEKLDAGTTRYNKALLILTMVMLLVAVIQALVPIFLSEQTNLAKSLEALGVGGLICYAFWKLQKELLQ